MNSLILLYCSAILIGMLGSHLPIRNKKTKRTFTVCTCGIILLIFHIFKDVDTLPDLINYIDLFEQFKNINFYNLFEIIAFGLIRFEPGWMTFTLIISQLFDSYFALIIASSFIIVVGYMIYIYRYSPIIWLSILILLCWGYCQSLYVLRQYCALVICFMSCPYILQRNLKKYLAFSILGVLFHYSAIVFIPLYWLYKIKLDSSFVRKMIFFSAVIAIVMKIVVSKIAASSSYYAIYFNGGDNDIGTSSTGFLINLAVFLLSVTTFKIQRLEGLDKLLFIQLCVAMILSLVGIGISGIVRLNLYYTSCYIIYIPIVVNKMKKLYRLPCSVIIAACFTMLFLINLKGQSLSNFALTF